MNFNFQKPLLWSLNSQQRENITHLHHVLASGVSNPGEVMWWCMIRSGVRMYASWCLFLLCLCFASCNKCSFSNLHLLLVVMVSRFHVTVLCFCFCLDLLVFSIGTYSRYVCCNSRKIGIFIVVSLCVSVQFSKILLIHLELYLYIHRLFVSVVVTQLRACCISGMNCIVGWQYKLPV